MAAQLKITSVWPARDTDREDVVGHFGFVWKPDPDLDQIVGQRLVKDDEGKYSRRDNIQIDGATTVRVKVADVITYIDKQSREQRLFVSVDGLKLEREIADRLLDMVRKPLADAIAKLKAGETIADTEAGVGAGEDIPF